jgi:hypothetical protein
VAQENPAAVLDGSGAVCKLMRTSPGKRDTQNNRTTLSVSRPFLCREKSPADGSMDIF